MAASERHTGTDNEPYDTRWCLVSKRNKTIEMHAPEEVKNAFSAQVCRLRPVSRHVVYLCEGRT